MEILADLEAVEALPDRVLSLALRLRGDAPPWPQGSTSASARLETRVCRSPGLRSRRSPRLNAPLSTHARAQR